jgi:hypothetical protein
MRNQRTWNKSVAVLAAGAALLGTLRAQSFNVDIGANPLTTPSSGYGAAAASPGHWNAFNAASGAPQQLADLSGSPTGVQLTIVGGQGNFLFNNTLTTGDDAALMDDTGDLNLAGGGLDVANYTFSGMSNGRYDVYTYAWAPDAPYFTTFTDVGGGIPCAQLCGGGQWTGAHVAGVTYIKETVVVTNNQLSLTVNTDLGWGSCNGIQVVANNSGAGARLAAFDIGTEEQNPLDATTAFGRYWVSGKNPLDPTVPPHRIHEYTGISHSYLASFSVLTTSPSLTQVDHAGSIVASTTSAGDKQLLVFDDQMGRSTYKYTRSGTAGGAGTLTQTFTTAGTHKKEVDFNPISGVYYSITSTGDIEAFFFDSAGVAHQLTQFPPPPSTLLVGLAIDYVSNILWGFSQTSPCGGSTNLVEFVPMNPADGTVLGPSFFGDMTLAGANVAISCHICVDPANPGALAICALQSGPPAHVVLYSLGVSVSTVVNYCTPSTTSHGCVPVMSSNGLPSVSATSGFTVTAANVEGQKQGLIFYGINNTGFTPLPWSPNSTSFLCVKSPTQRTPVQNGGGTLNACNGVLSVDLLAFLAANPGALGSPFAAGSPVYLQAWFRDPPAPKTTNLSDALQVTMLP